MLPLLKPSLAQTIMDNWNCDAAFISGSGKTFTMQPLPLRAAEDLVRLLHQPVYRNQRFKLWLSFFEIYGGKLFDLLSERKLVFPCFLLVYFICLLTSRVFRTLYQLDSICNGGKDDFEISADIIPHMHHVFLGCLLLWLKVTLLWVHLMWFWYKKS